ncbi:MAG: ECF transporter S component [Blautia sp.]|jgi:energy-coupling factor transport system substrate-specific component
MKLKLKDVLMIAISAVLFGLLYLGMVYLGSFLTTLLTPMGLGILGYEPIYGIWFMAAVFTTLVLQKPGVGVITEMLAAILEVLMGNMFGPIIFISGFIQGLGSEVAFAAGKYKKYTYKTTMLAAVLCTVFTFIWTGIRQNYLTFDPKILVAIFAIRLVSSLIFCGIGSKLLADGLAKAGVLKAYPLGQQYLDFEEIEG